MRWLLPAVALGACLPLAEPLPILCHVDGDGDGYGVAATFEFVGASCDEAPAGARDDNDCDDDDPAVHPGVRDELDDGVDQDCWGGDRITCFVDADEDGYGDESFDEDADECEGAHQRSATGGDCDDADDGIFPGATEQFGDAIDQDCDGVDSIPCWFDGDGDGFGSGAPAPEPDGQCDGATQALVDGDCDDGADWRYPGAAELCNGFDDDCDGVTDLGGHARAGAEQTLQFAGAVAWGAFTVELRLDGLHHGGPTLVHRSPSGDEELRILHTGAGWRLTWPGLGTPIPGPDGALGSLALVSDGLELRWYVDGVATLDATAGGPDSWSPDGTWTLETGDEGPVGVDEIRLWSLPRSATDLAAGHCRPVPPDPLGNLKVRLPFEEDFDDASGSGNHAAASPGWVLDAAGI